MASLEHSSDQDNRSFEREAHETLRKVIADLREAASGLMGENEPYFNKQLGRIIRRLEAFAYEVSNASSEAGYRERANHLFRHAKQDESILVSEARDGTEQELTWRLVRELGDSLLFWEATLLNSEQEKCLVALQQSTPSTERVNANPYIITNYLDFHAQRLGETLHELSPRLMATVTDGPEVSVLEYSIENDIVYPLMSLEEMKRLFYQPE